MNGTPDPKPKRALNAKSALLVELRQVLGKPDPTILPQLLNFDSAFHMKLAGFKTRMPIDVAQEHAFDRFDFVARLVLESLSKSDISVSKYETFLDWLREDSIEYLSEHVGEDLVRNAKATYLVIIDDRKRSWLEKARNEAAVREAMSASDLTLRPLLQSTGNIREKLIAKAPSEVLAKLYRDAELRGQSIGKAFPGLGWDKLSAGLGYSVQRSKEFEALETADAVMRVIKLELLQRDDLKLIESPPASLKTAPASDACSAKSAKPRRTNAAAAPSRPSHKGDPSLLGDAEVVNFRVAERYAGITSRQRQYLMRDGILEIRGGGRNRMITTDSLKKYVPPTENRK